MSSTSPCIEASLMTMVASSNQSETVDIKLENWSNNSINPSSSVALPIGPQVDGSYSSAIIISFTLFTDSSVAIFFSVWLSGFFLKLYLSPILPKRHLMVSILTDISLPDLIGWDAWNERVPIGNKLLLLLLL